MVLFTGLFFPGCDDGGKETEETTLSYNNAEGVVANMADPYILEYNDRYYLYGTDDQPGEVDRGFKVYTSTDLVNWSQPVGKGEGGRALLSSDSWGNWGFWGAEVYLRDSIFYMFYTVEEHLAVATGTSPLGPFTQQEKKPLRNVKEIDCHVHVDDDGKAYMYYVSFENNSNEIFVEELNDDWLSTKPETKTRCIWWTQAWENADPEFSHWPVAEGSSVLKHEGIYYLFYTANHFLSQKYAVGYATSDSPYGPWNKYEGNPVLKQTDRLRGTGHCSFVRSPSDDLVMVYHAHRDTSQATPRKMCIDLCEFLPDPDGEGPDIFKVYATDSIQEVSW